MAPTTTRLLLVEDNPADARLLMENLAETSGADFRVTHVVQLSEAIQALTTDRCDIILLDLSLPDSQGLDTVRRVHGAAPATAIVVLTGADDEFLGVEAIREGAQDYLVKGQADRRLLVRAIRYAIQRQAAEEELARYRNRLEELVANRTAALAATNEVLQQEIVERARTEEALREARRKLMTDREHQRRRLAIELHDAVGQGLVGLKLALDHVMNLGKDALAPGTTQMLKGAVEKCSTIVREVRAISHGLYPALLESFGLVPALKGLAEDTPASIPVTVHYPPTLETARFSRDAEIALFRIAQEAVQNAVRHSRADRIDIHLTAENSVLGLAIVDNGAGFDPHKRHGKGLGLLSMRERALTAGGQLRLTSRPGETRVEVRLPADACAPHDSNSA